MIGVYQIKNLKNKKRYIGSTIDLELRKKCHFRDLAGNRHHNPHLQNAWNRYGAGVFEFSVIKVTETEQEARDIEQRYIDSGEDLYNIADEVGSPPVFRGEDHPQSTLAEEDAIEMRKLYAKGVSLGSLGARYNYKAVSGIVSGAWWSHLGGKVYRGGKAAWRTRPDGGLEKVIVPRHQFAEFENPFAAITEAIERHEGAPRLSGVILC